MAQRHASPDSTIERKFSREHRILVGKHFQAVFANRQRLHGQFFSFHLLPNQCDFFRLGLAVSKKVSKKAVDRNRIKRVTRDSFRHFQAKIQLSISQEAGGISLIDIVVVAKPAAARGDNNELRKELSYFWKKITNRIAAIKDSEDTQVMSVDKPKDQVKDS